MLCFYSSFMRLRVCVCALTDSTGSNSATKVVEVIGGGNIVIVRLELDIRVDRDEGLHCCTNLAKSTLFWTEEKSVHVC